MEYNEDYMKGYKNGTVSTNAYAHAKLMTVYLYIEKLMNELAEPGVL
jgi:hypothetical protein